MLRPRWLTETMELAQRVEEKHQREKASKSKTMGVAYRNTPMTQAPRNRTLSLREAPKEKSIGVFLGGNFKLLIEGEVQDRQAKGLCFKCDYRFTLYTNAFNQIIS